MLLQLLDLCLDLCLGLDQGVTVILTAFVASVKATKEAVTCFVKKQNEVEQDRQKEKRINTVITRKVALVALTDATKAVKITVTPQ